MVIPCFNINPIQSNSFFPREKFLIKSQQVLFFAVLLLPLIGMQKNACSSRRSSGTSVSLLFETVTNLFDPWEILTQEWVLSLPKDIMTSTPCLPYKQLVATSYTGLILVFSRIQPWGCDAASSLGRVCTTSHWKSCVWSPVCIHTEFTQFVLWQRLNSFFILLQ